MAPLPFWQVTRRELLKKDDDRLPKPAPLTREDLAPKGVEPWVADAVAWSTLRRRVDTLLEVIPRRSPLEVKRLVEAVARCRPLGTRRRRAKKRWPKQLCLVVDRDNGLAPLWIDQERFIKRCARRLGRDGLHVEYLLAGPESPCVRTTGRRLAPGAPTLILTGWSHPAGAQRIVEGFARRERARGLRGRPVVLRGAGGTPPPCSKVAPDMRTLPWDVTARVGEADQVTAFLACWILERVLAVPVFFEPGLLRELRLALALPGAGVGTELAVWAGVRHPHADGGTMDRAARVRKIEELTAALRSSPQQLASSLDDEEAPFTITADDAVQLQASLRRALRALYASLRAWRVAASPAVLHEEHLTLDVCYSLEDPENPITAEDRTQAEHFIRGAESGLTDPSLGPLLAGWLARSFERAPPALATGARHRFLFEAWQASLQNQQALPTQWTLAQRGRDLVVHSQPAVLSPQPVRNAKIGWLSSKGPLATLTIETVPSPVLLKEGERVALPAAPCRLSSDREHLHVQPFVRKPWMSAVGVGEGGLWIEVGEYFERLRFTWQPPKEPHSLDEPAEGSFEIEPDTLPPWAARAGIDRFGAWADIQHGRATYRLRWVPPGSFLMGSPESEWGRYQDESLHPVELTAGFWLGETPCTQAFYEAVVGQNPSQHRGAERPVDSVSWKVAVAMIAKLNQGVPGLGGRLPTEAEWEYACRAGTKTATYAGDLTEDTVDSVLDPIAWHPGNSADQTQPVRKKRANPWGFHDLLGNVLEWCSDWYAGYDAGPGTDPLGPESGSRRVLRGGDWDWFARDCRAASRDPFVPGDRGGGIGFRLSRGHGFVSSRSGAES